MNMNQKQILNTINRAYDKLRVLNNITWTAYREDLFSMNLKDEKRHRQSFGSDHRQYETPQADCARLFVVQHIATSILNPDLYKVQDLLHIRESAIKAQALVNNYGKVILEAWKDEDIKTLSELDYISLIDFEEYQKNQADRKESEATA